MAFAVHFELLVQFLTCLYASRAIFTFSFLMIGFLNF